MSAISDKYAQLGGNASFLGAPLAAEATCPDGDGRFRHYAGGSIYWHTDTGAHEVHGAIRDRWKSIGWELSWLGYPSTDEGATPGGRRSTFQNGRIDWTSTQGAVDTGVPEFVSYPDRDGASHQAEYLALRASHRMIALNVYGLVTNPRYAATWVRRAGPAWVAAHGRTHQELDQWLRDQAALGFHPTLVAGIGNPLVGAFAAVAEKISGAPPLWRLNLRFGSASDPGTLQYWNAWARMNHYVLVSLASYGEASMPLVAAVWHRNDTATAWTPAIGPALAPVDARMFNVQRTHGARPYILERGEGLASYVTGYRDDAVGPWSTRGNLSLPDYTIELAARKAEGYFPCAVVGSGSGPAVRFNVLFTKREQPLPCRFVATGVAVPSMRAFDEAVAGYMRRNDIRAGTLAVARRGKLKLARGYTWAPPQYPITTPRTIFRIGSISKLLTNILIHQLIERDHLSMDTAVQGRLALTPPDGMAQANLSFPTVTVAHLLAHRSGIRRDFADLDAQTVAAFDGTLPVTSKRQLASMLLTIAAEFPPDSLPMGDSVYANSGYLVLGALIEHIMGGPWFTVLRNNVLNPLGLTRPAPSGSLLSQRAPGEALYHDATLSIVPSIMTASQPPELVRDGYGNINLSVGDAVGGMAFGAADLVKVLSAFSSNVSSVVMGRTTIEDEMWGNPRGWWPVTLPNGVTSLGHNGGLTNMQADTFARSDDVMFAVAFNKGSNQFEPPPIWHDLVDGVQSWPAHDLFPSLDIPAFT